MTPKILSAFALGAILGVCITYWFMRAPFGNQYIIKHSDSALNMSDPGQRDLAISYWYEGMTFVVESLERNTGHTFTKQLGKLHAGPVEILEEQIEFMKAYRKESEKLSEERRAQYLKTEKSNQTVKPTR